MSRIRTAAPLGRPDRTTTAICATALICLWCARFAQRAFTTVWPDSSQTRLTELSWWAGTQILFYGIVPLVVLAALGLRPARLGWKVRGIARHGSVYLALFVIAVPFIFAASQRASFLEHYPILEISAGQHDVWRDLAVWWPLYALQFVAIEVFFRGVLVLGLADVLGSMSVLVAVIPYMMIHFVKPPAEAAASVLGGIVLGSLTLRTRSIIWGIALHIAIAATMDVMALAHKGFIW